MNSELKIPSRQKQQTVINDIIKKNDKYIQESVKSWIDQAIPKNTWSRYEIESDYDGGIKGFINDTVKQWRNNTSSQLAYSVSQSLGLAPNVKKEIISELKKQGYNAMTDEASVGGQNGWKKEGYDPLIIFDSSILTKTGVSKISSKDEKRSKNRYINWQNKINADSRKLVQWSAM